MANVNFNPLIPENLAESLEAIEYVLKEAKINSGELKRRIISRATLRQIKDLKEDGIAIDENWVHSMETSAVKHAQRRHGNEESERTENKLR